MIDLSPTRKARFFLGTVAGTLVCVLLAFAIDGFSLETGTWSLADRWINNLIIPVVVAPPFFFVLLSKLRELSLAHQKLLIIAATDPLTRCLNRGAFSRLVDAYLERLDRAERNGALLVIDIDHFKEVNDRFGHDRGDEALKLIADTIKGSVREIDLVSRLGGEEFGVFLPGLDPSRALTVAERIRDAVETAPSVENGAAYPLSLSIGGVAFTPPTTFAQLYRTADRKLYEAKNRGRNRVVFDSDFMNR